MDLPGVDVDAINLEVRGRSLVITGERPVRETEGRDLPAGRAALRPLPPGDRAAGRRRRRRGPGRLRGRDPPHRAAGPACRTQRARCRSRESTRKDERPRQRLGRRPDGRGRGARDRGGGAPGARRRAGGRAAAPRGPAGPAAARDRHLPRHADPAGGRPGALDEARRRRPVGQPDARDGRVEGAGQRAARARGALRRRRRRHGGPDDEGARRHAADPGPGRRAGDALGLRRRAALPDRERVAPSPT